MTIESFTLSPSDMAEESNKTRKIFLNAMIKEELITQEQAESMDAYQIICCKATWFTAFKNIFKRADDDKDRYQYNVVKFVDK